ncbi:MAG: sulfurtransferase-like selenium metabolism protein YedF [bacterium]
MMTIEVDARGLVCPQPVICTKKALDSISDGTVTAIVDNTVARDNIVKFARSAACDVSVTEKGTDYLIKISKGTVPELEEPLLDTDDTVLLVTGESLGRGDDNLGNILMKNFLYSLSESSPLPKKIILMNGGVKLAAEGNEALGFLHRLAEQGVEIAACGICLDYLHLKEKLAVGQITNMYSVVEALSLARKVIVI